MIIESRWLLNTSQFTIQINIYGHKVLPFKGCCLTEVTAYTGFTACPFTAFL